MSHLQETYPSKEVAWRTPSPDRPGVGGRAAMALLQGTGHMSHGRPLPHLQRARENPPKTAPKMMRYLLSFKLLFFFYWICFLGPKVFLLLTHLLSRNLREALLCPIYR